MEKSPDMAHRPYQDEAGKHWLWLHVSHAGGLAIYWFGGGDHSHKVVNFIPNLFI